MKYPVFLAVYLAAIAFAILGPWLSDDLAGIVIETALNNGQGTVLDYLGMLFFYILNTPFFLVVTFSTTPGILYALNGAFWACTCWIVWWIWRRIQNRKS